MDIPQSASPSILTGNISSQPASRLTHAYIASGPAADDLAMAVVCDASGSIGNINKPCRKCEDCRKASRHIHPDILTINRLRNKDGKLKLEILVDQIRFLKTDVYIMPNQANKKAYIINDADTMNVNAQNALLQMLEEPPAHAVFILNTQNPHALLPTVRSRCIDMTPASKQSETAAKSDDSDEPARLASFFVNGLDNNMTLIECMFLIEQLGRSEFIDFVTMTRSEISKVLRDNPRNKRAITAISILEIAAQMLDVNVNMGHVSAFISASLLND